MASMYPQPKAQFFTSNGDPAVGYKVYTYVSDGTFSTLKTTYSDSINTPNTNPIILDSRGEAVIFWDGVYDVRLETDTGSLVWTQTNVGAGFNDPAYMVYTPPGGTATTVAAALDSLLFATMEDLRVSTENYDHVVVNAFYAAGPAIEIRLHRDGSGTPTSSGAANIAAALAAGTFCNAAGFGYSLSSGQKITPFTFGCTGVGADVSLGPEFESFTDFIQANGGSYPIEAGEYVAASLTISDTTAPNVSIEGRGATVTHSIDDTAVLRFEDDLTDRLQRPAGQGMTLVSTGAHATNNEGALKLRGVDFGLFWGLALESAGVGATIQYGNASLGPYSGSPSDVIGWEDQPERLGHGNVLAFSKSVTDRMGIETFAQLSAVILGNYVTSDGAAGSSHAFRLTGYPGMRQEHGKYVANFSENMLNGYSLQSSCRYNSINAATIRNVTSSGVELVNVTYDDIGIECNYIQAIVENSAGWGLLAFRADRLRTDVIVDGALTGMSFSASASYKGANAWNINDAIISKVTGNAAFIGTDYSHHRITASECSTTTTAVRVTGSYNVIDLIVDAMATAATYQLTLEGNGNIVRFIGEASADTNIVVSGDDNDITAICASVSFGSAASGNRLRGKVTTLSGSGLAANDTSGVAGTQAATAANILSIAHVVNTVGKVAGRQVWDTTNNRIMVASGALAASPWYIADGSASVTPV